MRIIRPHNIVDIKTARVTSFTRLSRRVSLYSAPKRFIVRPLFTGLVVSLLVASLFLSGFVTAPTYTSLSLAATDSNAERAQLEAQLAQLEGQISQYEDTISSYKKQGTSLKSEIDRLNAQVNKINLQIKATTLSLQKLNDEINTNQKQIDVTQQKIDLHRDAIARSLQNVYENEHVTLVAVLLQHPNLTDFFGDINNMLDVQSDLTVSVQEIDQLKDELLDQKDELAAKKSDAEAFKAYQDAQRKAALTTKQTKDQLLSVTKGQESKYQDLLLKTRQTAAQIRSRIFETLGGGEMTFEDAYKFAQYAEQATGVRAALILAVLDHESALGQNVGRCNYKGAMAPGAPKSKRDDVTPFLAITSELGINPDTIMVSCANRDGAYGGAMGPAQFIPTTWMLYKNRIASLTGNNPPSPWRNGDAFVATALYFQDALRACSAYTGTAQERCAAARYYAGGSWRSFLYTYGDRVVVKARQFEQDIQVLSS